MLSPRWKKVMGDALAARGRLTLMTLALAVSVAGLATMLTVYSVLTREVSRNYMSTNPAAAQIMTERVDETLLAGVRRLAGVADAEALSVVRGRVITGAGELRPLLLFVIPDFQRLRINSVRLVSGMWPSTQGTIVLERTAIDVAGAGVGQSVQIRLPQGEPTSLRIVGAVHDPSLAPAWQEQTVYGYVTPATLATFGGPTDLRTVKLAVQDAAADAQAIEAVGKEVATWIGRTGRVVQEVRVPPPRLHPHQAQMTTVLKMLVVFSVLGLILGSVLAATIVSGLLTPQVREIAVMKAIGARSAQIIVLYLVLIATVSLGATIVGTVLGVAAGRAWSTVTADVLNLDIQSYAAPTTLLVVNSLLGVLVPLVAAAIPVLAAGRRAVRDSIGDRGISRTALSSESISQRLARFRLLGPAGTLGLRNAFRRRGRLVLGAVLMAVAGGIFISSANLRSAWNSNVAAAAAARHYDLEITFEEPASEQAVTRVISLLPGVREVESWSTSPVNIDSGDHMDVSRTYPDGGHGGIVLRAVPANTSFVDHDLVAGRWLRPEDDNAVVLNTTVQALSFRNVKMGDRVELIVRHRARQFRVVGIVREVLTPGAIYTTPAAFRDADFPIGATNAVRVALRDRSQAERVAVTAAAALERTGVGVRSVITERILSASQGGHIYILVYALGFIAALIALIGMLGLASMLSTGVVERTREFGILRAIGTRATDIRRVVLAEALAGGVIGAVLAIPVSIPLSAVVGRIVGLLSLQPLTLRPAPVPISLWFTIALLGSAIAGLYPSVLAARLTVREALVTF